MKGLPSKCKVLKVICYRTGKHTVCRHARAFFSPEILQAGTVKGLRDDVFGFKPLRVYGCVPMQLGLAPCGTLCVEQ